MSRIDTLVEMFNGAIKYTPMLQDHPDWTDEQCVEFALTHHRIAIEGLRKHGSSGPWNDGIPYCRNIPNASMLKEAGV